MNPLAPSTTVPLTPVCEGRQAAEIADRAIRLFVEYGEAFNLDADEARLMAVREVLTDHSIDLGQLRDDLAALERGAFRG